MLGFSVGCLDADEFFRWSLPVVTRCPRRSQSIIGACSRTLGHMIGSRLHRRRLRCHRRVAVAVGVVFDAEDEGHGLVASLEPRRHDMGITAWRPLTPSQPPQRLRDTLPEPQEGSSLARGILAAFIVVPFAVAISFGTAERGPSHRRASDPTKEIVFKANWGGTFVGNDDHTATANSGARGRRRRRRDPGLLLDGRSDLPDDHGRCHRWRRRCRRAQVLDQQERPNWRHRPHRPRRRRHRRAIPRGARARCREAHYSRLPSSASCSWRSSSSLAISSSRVASTEDGQGPEDRPRRQPPASQPQASRPSAGRRHLRFPATHRNGPSRRAGRPTSSPLAHFSPRSSHPRSSSPTSSPVSPSEGKSSPSTSSPF